MAEPTMYERIVAAREALGNGGYAHAIETCLEALERQYAPSAEPDPAVEKEYETMEEAAFGVAKAAKAYVEAVGGGAIDSFGIVTAFDALKEEVRKYNECAEQYESHWE